MTKYNINLFFLCLWLVNFPTLVKAEISSQPLGGNAGMYPETSCTFSVEKTSNHLNFLLDFEEIGFSTSQPTPNDDFGYTKKIRHIQFLSKYGLVPLVAGYLSQIHHKIPDFSEHLLERILSSSIVIDDGEEHVNGETCLYDMIHLGTPLNTDNQYVVLPLGMAATNTDASSPTFTKSDYFINGSLFEKLDQHNKLGVFMSLVIRDYLQIAHVNSGNIGLGVRTLVAAIFSNLKFSDSKYLSKVEQIMSQIDTGYLLYWTEDHAKSYGWKKRCFNSSDLSCLVSINRPLPGYFSFQYFPLFRYQSFGAKEQLNLECKPLEEAVRYSISAINTNLDKINRHIKNLVASTSFDCKKDFIEGAISGFIFKDETVFCDSSGKLLHPFRFKDYNGYLRNEAYFSNKRTDIYDESGFGYGSGMYKKIVEVKLANNQVINVDLSKIIDWPDFKSSTTKFSQQFADLFKNGFQCRHVDYTDLINLRNITVE